MGDEQVIRGKISVDVDEEGLLAVLSFSPDESGNEYSRQDLRRLIAEHKIVYGIDSKGLDEKLASLMDASAEKVITVAEGEPAVLPVPEEYVWYELAPSPEHESDIEKTLLNAPPPEIWDVQIEKVKKEKKIKKKGLLPFVKEKEETVVEIEKREKRVRVDVVPDVISFGWAEKGALVAEISPGVPGKTGKDVYGKPIQPPSGKDEFWLGKGIEKKGKKVTASESGILRRGWNWIEVLPFEKHEWEVGISGDRNTCLLSFSPGGPESTPPDASQILEKALELGFPAETLIPAEEIGLLVSKSLETGRPLEKVSLSCDDDSSFEIRVSDDKMKAELFIHKARGNGNQLVLKDVGKAIKESGLKGMNLKEIQDAILAYYKGPETDLLYTLAEGEPAGEGEAGELVYELGFLDDVRKSEILGRVSGADAGSVLQWAPESGEEFPPAGASALAFVQENQMVARLDVKAGTKGRDVYGAEVSASAADIPGVRSLEGTEFRNGTVVSLKAGLLERFDFDGGHAFRVREHLDAGIEVHVASDRMTATISISPAAGTGRPPSLEEVNRCVEEAGVRAGIDAESLRAALDKARNGEEVSGALFAMGRAPKNAGEYQIKYMVEMASGKAVSIGEGGKADFRKQNRFTNVKEGDIIAEIRVLQGDVQDGQDVLGNTLPAKQLAPLNLDIGNNIKQETDDGGDIFLVAEKSGRLVQDKNKIEIQDVLFIKGDVDYGSGNIKFSGDVQVKGNVRDGFFVMAGGSIMVGMGVEMALLSSEKSVMVAQGVKGRGKAIVRVKEDIRLSFAERTTLLAVDNILVKNAVLGCRVKCNGSLRLTGEKGYLVGGRIQARKGVEAANVGSLSGTRTFISFGQDYLIGDQIEIEEKEIARIKQSLLKIEPRMKALEKHKDLESLNKLRHEKVKLMKVMEKRSMRVFTLKERFEQHFPCEVRIRGEVFPGVVFESHGRTLEINSREKDLRVFFNEETGILEKETVKKKNASEKEH